VTRRLRILHVDPERQWGGGEAQVLGLSQYLDKAGHVSHVAVHPHGILAQRLHAAKLVTIPLSIRNHLDGIAGWQLRRMVRNGRYDLVHFHTARAHALSPWVHGLPIKRVVTRRMDYPISPGWASHFLYTKNVDMVIAISSGVRAALRAADILDTHIRVIPSGIDSKQFVPNPDQRATVRQQYGLTEDALLVLAVGALVERKSHQTLIDAAARLKQNGIALHYIICGAGPLRAMLETQARALGLNSHVHFAGFCHNLPAHLAAADFFVHTPLWEGLGIAVLEALAAGLPVVASRVGGIPELITHQVSGLLIPPKDPSALEIALTKYVHNPDWAKTLGQAGRTAAHARFDIAATAQANEALYYELFI